MNRARISNFAKGSVILTGFICLAFAVGELPRATLGWGFLLVLAFSTVVAPRMSLTLPHSKFTISFSDSVIFLSFLLYGGEVAIITAFVESISNCTYLKNRGIIKGRWIVIFNSSLAVLVTTCSLGVLAFFSRFMRAEDGLANTRTFITVLGLFALTQFFVSSIAAASYQSIKSGNLWEIWKGQGLSCSLTQFLGAGLAGLVFKLITDSDLLVIGIATFALGIIYLSYRQSIGEVKEAMQQAEAAEREKADAERARRREAEKYAEQLSRTLEKEEMANEALRRSERDLQHAALFDSLTDLPNRKHFGDELRRLIARYHDDPTATFQVLFLDLHRFKNINDSLGHSLGDKVLMIAAKRFVRMVNNEDMVARIGGDEFAILLKNLSTGGKAQKVARRIHDSISQPFSLSGNRIRINVNIGIAPCDAEYSIPEEVLRDADIAMHYAREKETGIAIFTKDMRVRFLERVRYENDLSHAIDRGEMTMNYQPLIDLQDGGLLGFEALLRWHHGEFGPIPPNKFIPIAEESGLIIPMTKWILETTCLQLAEWQKVSPACRDMIMSVNISGKHLSNDDLIDDVEYALSVSGIKPSTLKLEITESAAMENAEHTISTLNRLKAIGVQLSIDDFGTGYSSLSYLHRLPFDTLKIDRSFVYSVGERGENSEILQTIISLAKNLKMKVIAEGIETETQLSLLQNLGCDYGQGYLLARPQNKEAAERSLYERTGWLPRKLTDLIHNEAREIDPAEESLPVF